MTEEEINAASYEALMARNVALVAELKTASLRKDIPWHTLSVELAVLAEERRMVMARMAFLTKREMKR